MAKHTPRTLHIDGAAWRYLIGKTQAVVWAPTGQRRVVPLAEVCGRAQAVIEAGRAVAHDTRPPVPRAARHKMDEFHLRCLRERLAEATRSPRPFPSPRPLTPDEQKLLRTGRRPFSKRAWYGPIGSESEAIAQGMVRPSDVKAWIELTWLGKSAPSALPNLLCHCLRDVGVELQADPLAWEVYGDDTEYVMCRDCADRSAMEI